MIWFVVQAAAGSGPVAYLTNCALVVETSTARSWPTPGAERRGAPPPSHPRGVVKINPPAEALALHGADTRVESVSNAGSVMHTVTGKVITAPSPIVGDGRTRTADGVVVSTAISAGGVDAQHGEGIVISTAITAGGVQAQHGEGIVVSTPIIAGGISGNHGEGVVVSAAITAGGLESNHSEMLVEHPRKKQPA